MTNPPTGASTAPPSRGADRERARQPSAPRTPDRPFARSASTAVRPAHRAV